MIPLLCFSIIMPVSEPTADQSKKILAKEIEKFQGTWKSVESKNDIQVVFAGDKVSFGDRLACRFRLDPSKEPKWYDQEINALFGGKEEVYATGIYQLDGDKLTIALVTEMKNDEFRPRPKNFKDKFHGQLIHLEKVKK